MDKPRIVIIAIVEISTYYGNLWKGLNAIGFPAKFITLKRDNKYNYPGAGKGFWSLKMAYNLNSIVLSQRLPRQLRILFFLLCSPIIYPLRFYAVFRLIRSADVIICGAVFSLFTTSVDYALGLDYFDYRMLRKFNKTIIAAFNGDRPVYLNGLFSYCSPAAIAQLSKQQKRKYRAFSRYVTHIIDNPLCSQFHVRPFINYFKIGAAFTQSDIQASHDTDSIPIIVHAPTHLESKGTNIVREVMEELKSHYAFTYVEFTNKPNREVLETMAKCSFVINELYSDSLMAGVDTEAAFFGKPSIIAGYELEKFKVSLQPDEVPPTITIYPSKDALKQMVITLLEDKEYTAKLGQRAQDFVYNQWNFKEVAKRYIRIINGDIPESWYCDPSLIHYFHGYGLNNEKRRAIISAIIAQHGKDALQLSDKPKLEADILHDLEVEI